MSTQPARVAVPFAPPRLTRNEAEALTLLAQRVQRLECPLGDTVWEFSMEPLARGAATAFGAADWLVRAEWAGAPFELRVPGAAADQWLRARFASLELPQLPAAIRNAAFESVLHGALATLETVGQGPARIDGIEETSAPAAPSICGHHFGLSLVHGGVTVWGTLSTDALGLMLMAGLAARWPGARGVLAPGRVPVRLRAEIGSATLSRAELTSLSAGDAILLQHGWVDRERQLWLSHRGWGLRVRAEGSRLVVTEPFHLVEQEMDDEEIDDNDSDEFHPLDDTGEALDDDQPMGLDALPVRLQFDLGQRTMPLAEVSELQVGQVLELSRPLSQAVSIRANGVLIGTGELMEIGGRIAVGITALGHVGA
jgi:type III secretion protein Q